MFFGIILLVATGLTWVVIGIVISDSAKKHHDLSLIQGASALLICLVSVMVMLCKGVGSPTWPALLWSGGALLLAGVGNFICFQCMNAAMKSGPHGIVWSLSQSALVFPFLMGVLFFGVSCNIFRITGAILIITTIIILGCRKNVSEAGTGKNWLLPALLAFVVGGLTQCMANICSYFPEMAEVSSVWKTFALQIGTMIMSIGTLAGNRRKPIKLPIKPVLVLSGAILLSQYWLFFNGLDIVAAHHAGSIGYPIVLVSCIMGFYGYSLLFLKEKITILSGSALVMCITGIFLLCID